MSAFNFIGPYNQSVKYQIGDVVEDNGYIKVFDGQGFTVIGTPDDNPVSPIKILPKNCTQCGAPVNSLRIRCEYCGCEY